MLRLDPPPVYVSLRLRDRCARVNEVEREAVGGMRVWIARAEPAASVTAARLRALGHEALVGPVLEIAATRDPPPGGPFDAILLTSANAAGPWLRDASPHAPVLAVGGRTAEAARAAGRRDVVTADGDAAALAALVRARLRPGACLLHAAAATRKPEPEASLTDAGYAVTVWVAYAAAPVSGLPAAVAEALADGADAPLQVVLHYSRRSAALARDLAGAAGRGPAFRALRHLCLSSDVAVPLVEAGIGAHFVAARPDETSLLAILADLP